MTYLHLVGFLIALVAVVIVLVRTLRGTADRIESIMAVAICCDIGAEIVSTLPVDLMAAREISPVLPMAAVLAGRVIGPRLTVRWRQGVLAGVLALLTLNLVAYAPPRAEPSEGQVVADWLRERNLGLRPRRLLGVEQHHRHHRAEGDRRAGRSATATG